jgi:O-antigen/teichoic acid export membrane protein
LKKAEKWNKVEIRGRLLVRNTLLNFIGQTVPLLVGVVTIPFIVRGLGTERFGLFSLALVVLGYFTIFDLGLGQAVTKFVAEAFGKGEVTGIPCLVWTAVIGQAILGIIGALTLVEITPLLVERILSIPHELIGEARTTFYLLALSIPAVLISASFRGVLEAFQRFDLVNAVKILTSIAIYLLPLLGLLWGFHLPGIILLIFGARVVALFVFAMLAIYLRPELKKFSISFPLFPRLFFFGGWVTLARSVGAILAYSDRFLIGSLLSMSAVAYYTTPFEVVTKLWIIPASFVITLFPVFSYFIGTNDNYKISEFVAHSLKYLLLIQWPIVLVIMLFAGEILQVWLGLDFAQKSTLPLQILALGVLFSSIAHIPSYLFQGIGRPDLTAKFYLLELPIYLVTIWFLIKNCGIAGAAVAWTLRAFLDVSLLFGASFKVYQVLPRLLINNGVFSIVFTLLAVSAMAYSLKIFVNGFSLWVKMLIFTIFFSAFGYFSWKKLLNSSDRKIVLKMIMKREGL